MHRPSRDAVTAAAVGLIAFGLYRLTLYPGLVGSGDTPELQFVGRVLGTAHTPGYPLYVLLSSVFARLPFGDLAHRINLMSACFGALAAALTVLALRRLGCRTATAVAGALALASGRVFWSQATKAEVYTLAAALQLGMLLALLAWAESRRTEALLAAVGIAGLALGHHYTDLVTVAPAVVLFVLWTDHRAALRPRVLGWGAALLGLGVAQYGWVLLRTHQGAPYLGTHASTLGELLTVLRGGSFAGRLFAFDARTLVTQRLPLLGRLLLEELTWVGLALLLLGLAVLARRRRPVALLLALGAAGPAFFALNYDVPDLAVFLLPSVVLLWLGAGVGLEAVRSALDRLAPSRVTATAVLLLPVGLVFVNYRASDHHARSFEGRYFKALVDGVPDRSTLLAESYTVDQMLRYEMLGEGFAARKRLALSGRDDESLDAFRRKGYTLFAFERGQEDLAGRGWALAPVTIPAATIEQHLAALPGDTITLLARNDGYDSCSVALAVSGRSSGLARRGAEAELRLSPGEAIGASGRAAPVALRVVCSREGALAEVSGRPVARAERGAALAVLAPAGRVLERHALDLEQGLQVPFDRRAFPFYRVAAAPACSEIGNRGFVDAAEAAGSGRVLVRFDNVDPFESSLVLWLGRERPLSPRLAEERGRGTPRLEVASFAGRADAVALARALRADGLDLGQPVAREGFVTRLELRVNDQGDFAAVTLDLGGLPRQALASARVDRDSPRRALLCGLPAGGVALLDDGADVARVPPGAEGEARLGAGWHRAERAGAAEFRWTAEPEAELLLALARTGNLAVHLRAMPAGGAPASLELFANGVSFGPRALRPGWSDLEWAVPAAAWRVGTNQVLLRVPGMRPPTAGEPRALGVAVGRFRLALYGS